MGGGGGRGILRRCPAPQSCRIEYRHPRAPRLVVTREHTREDGCLLLARLCLLLLFHFYFPNGFETETKLHYDPHLSLVSYRNLSITGRTSLYPQHSTSKRPAIIVNSPSVLILVKKKRSDVYLFSFFFPSSSCKRNPATTELRTSYFPKPRRPFPVIQRQTGARRVRPRCEK